jgi:hypothetical protein
MKRRVNMPRKPTSEEKPKPRLRRPKKASLPAETQAPVAAQPAFDPAEVARLAHSYWMERGGQGGSAEADWHRAEQALKARAASSQG